MNLITLDFETYFDSDYTLFKMTTEAYVRDPRFKMHMLGIKRDSQPCSIFDSEQEGNFNYLGDSAHAVIAHHAQFDGLILAHCYGLRPAFWFDTLSMARLVFPHAKSHSLGALAEMLGLPKKTVPYEDFRGIRDLNERPGLYNRVAEGCVQDVELTYAVFKSLLPHVPRDELKIIDLTVRMFVEPALSLDRPRLAAYLQRVQAEKENALQTLGITKADLQSSEKFAALLRQLGVEPPRKPSPKHPEKTIYAFAKTDKAMEELGEHENVRIAALVAARLGSKSTIGETRAQGLLNMHGRGPLCVYINYCGAHTLRDSGGDSLNFQNPTRIVYDTNGKAVEGPAQKGEIRLSLMAPKGCQIVVVDASQIECRLVNWMAGQQDMLDKFRRREDIYSEIASTFYGELVDKSKPAMRGTGKQIILSCGFRAGAGSIKETARRGTYGPPVILSDAQALAARDLYRSTHPRVVDLWKYGDKSVLPALLQGGYDFPWGPMRVLDKRIYMPGGAWLDYSNLKWSGTHELFNKPYPDGFYTETRKGSKAMHGGILTQNVIEGLARTILMTAALQITPRYKIVMRTHDELAYLARTEEAAEALAFGLQVMKTPPAWAVGLPLEAEGGVDVRYSK